MCAHTANRTAKKLLCTGKQWKGERDVKREGKIPSHSDTDRDKICTNDKNVEFRDDLKVKNILQDKWSKSKFVGATKTYTEPA